VADFEKTKAEQEVELLKAKDELRKKEEERIAEREDKLVAARQALNEALAAERELEGLPEDAPAGHRAALEDKVALLRLKANHAARRAGLEPPYP
jgi:hypothetical protein